MKKYFIKVITLALFVPLFSCGSGDNSFNKTADPYIENLRETLLEINIKSGKQPIPKSIFQPRRVRALGYSSLVMVDEADYSVVLINKNGELLSEVGREGRGPQEFQNIAQLHVGQDGRIYLLDMLSFRISVYEVVSDSLAHMESFSYKNPSNHSLHRIYVTDYGTYGVYNQTEGFQTPDNNFLLYRLDNNFNPVEQILEMPGHERQKIDNSDQTLYTPGIYLQKTLWDADGEWFYYLTSHHPTIKKYNLRTGNREEVSYSEFEERSKSPQYLSFMKEYFDSIEDEEHWLPLEESNLLPLFSGFWVQDDKILLRMFYPAEEEGMMIYIDPNLEESAYFQAPQELSQITMHDNKMYGIDFKIDDHHRLMFFDLPAE